jgi:hypothetical protein
MPEYNIVTIRLEEKFLNTVERIRIGMRRAEGGVYVSRARVLKTLMDTGVVVMQKKLGNLRAKPRTSKTVSKSVPKSAKKIKSRARSNSKKK